MAWERGYYYRVRKAHGRVKREYIGNGPAAEFLAKHDAAEREIRQLEAMCVRREKAELDALDVDLRAMFETTNLVARAAMLAAGFHQHRRGEWRKRRGKDDSGV